MTYDGRGGGADWAGYQPEQQRGISGPMVAFIALLTVLVLALLVVAAYLFLRPGGPSGDGRAQGVVASSSSTTAAQTPQSPVTETAFTTPPQRETVTVTREAPAPLLNGSAMRGRGRRGRGAAGAPEAATPPRRGGPEAAPRVTGGSGPRRTARPGRLVVRRVLIFAVGAGSAGAGRARSRGAAR